MMPPNTCHGLCHPKCKNACQFNKYIWMRDYIEPPPELELIIDIYNLKQKDIDFIRVRAPNVYHDLLVQYKKEKTIRKDLENKKIGEELIDRKQVAPRKLPKPCKANKINRN